MSSHPSPDESPVSLQLQLPAQTSRSVYTKLVGSAFILDALVILSSLMLGYWIRFQTWVSHTGTPESSVLYFSDYFGHFVLGGILMILSLVNFRFYTRECLLSYPTTMRVIAKASLLWLLAFLCITLVLKVDPPISRMFSGITMVIMIVGLSLSRLLLHAFISKKKFSSSLRQRALVVGWNREFSESLDTFRAAPERHFDIVGAVAPPSGKFEHPVPNQMPVMGRFDDLELLLQMKICQMVIVTDDMLDNKKLLRLATICEKEMVEFMLVPTCFRVLLSGLHLESVGGVPVMGISRLPLHSARNQFLKRGLDIIGALIGLILSLPLIAIFGFLIYRESPGSIFYRQRRLGADGKIFEMIKLRSMKLNAESDGKVGWTVKNDPRRLKVGAFMRKWNIDEVPQFWNVLKGEMSLVGPRPERPELIEKFKEDIQHYNARHKIKPGITGWAQVSGLRGDTDLSERVRFDLHYIENWSVPFDMQIMLLTFFRRKGAC